MNKIAIFFSIGIFVVAVCGILVFNTFGPPEETALDSVSEFKVTAVAGNGRVYWDNKPIERKMIESARRVEMSQLRYDGETYLMTDNLAACEIMCNGVSILMAPNSYLHFSASGKELSLFDGEFLWKKEAPKKQSIVFIKNDASGAGNPTQRSLLLSLSGKIKNAPGLLRVWNYNGDLLFTLGTQKTTVSTNNLLVSRLPDSVKLFPILPAPAETAPEDKTITLAESGDSVIQFSWQEVPNSPHYIFRIYSSPYKESVLFERDLDKNTFTLDLLNLKDINELYWQVFPFDFDKNSEGSPSRMGHLKVVGALLNTESTLKQPTLVIEQFNIDADVVMIKGMTDPDANLTIDNEPVTVGIDGNFCHTITFSETGKYIIVIRAVSPAGVPTIVEKPAWTREDEPL